jgi:hypothetical protein
VHCFQVLCTKTDCLAYFNVIPTSEHSPEFSAFCMMVWIICIFSTKWSQLIFFIQGVLLFENHTMFCYNSSFSVARFSFQIHALNSSDFFQTCAKIMIDFVHNSSQFIAHVHPHLSFVVAYLIRCTLLLNYTNPNEQWLTCL